MRCRDDSTAPVPGILVAQLPRMSTRLPILAATPLGQPRLGPLVFASFIVFVANRLKTGVGMVVRGVAYPRLLRADHTGGQVGLDLRELDTVLDAGLGHDLVELLRFP
jgi:hypothetical protein